MAWVNVAVFTIGGTAGLSLYSAFNAPDAPDIPDAPPPASYFSYDAEGNLAGSQVWDAEKNAYIYKPAPLTEAQQEEKAARTQIKNQMLANLSETPADRLAAYDQYQQAFSGQLHRDVDRQYADIVSQTEESLEATGRTGSRADVDLRSELARRKLGADVDIAERSTLAKEDLAASDRQYWLSLLNYADSQASSEALEALQREQSTRVGAAAGTAAESARFRTDVGSELTKFQLEQEKNAAITKSFANLSGTLGASYAYGKAGVPTPTKTPTTTTQPVRPVTSGPGYALRGGY